MPLNMPDLFGTDKNGSQIEYYCKYCFVDGKFTSDATMEEMIQLCSKYISHITREQAIHNMRIQFPALKRWAQKEDTQNEYHKSINRVLDYINEHLNEKPDLETLSQIANISPFHFHRIFKAIIGENLGEYIQRLRLEYVAGKLRSTDMSLSSLADRSGYNNQQALSKAFKKHFGMPPRIYKSTGGDWQKYKASELTSRICKIGDRHLLYIRIIDEYGTPESYSTAWKKLYTYAILQGYFSQSSESLGISFDDPSVTNSEKCRFYACVSIENPIKPSSIYGYRKIDGGLYAIFTYKGAYKGLHDLYKNIYYEWLPKNKYKIRKGVFFEKYLNNPHEVNEEDILTEIYIPIK